MVIELKTWGEKLFFVLLGREILEFSFLVSVIFFFFWVLIII